MVRPNLGPTNARTKAVVKLPFIFQRFFPTGSNCQGNVGQFTNNALNHEELRSFCLFSWSSTVNFLSPNGVVSDKCTSVAVIKSGLAAMTTTLLYFSRFFFFEE